MNHLHKEGFWPPREGARQATLINAKTLAE
jgi:hypothetical protein